MNKTFKQNERVNIIQFIYKLEEKNFFLLRPDSSYKLFSYKVCSKTLIIFVPFANQNSTPNKVKKESVRKEQFGTIKIIPETKRSIQDFNYLRFQWANPVII